MQIKAKKKKVILIRHPNPEPTGQPCCAEEKGRVEQVHAARTSVRAGQDLSIVHAGFCTSFPWKRGF